MATYPPASHALSGIKTPSLLNEDEVVAAVRGIVFGFSEDMVGLLILPGYALSLLNTPNCKHLCSFLEEPGCTGEL